MEGSLNKDFFKTQMAGAPRRKAWGAICVLKKLLPLLLANDEASSPRVSGSSRMAKHLRGKVKALFIVREAVSRETIAEARGSFPGD